MQRGLLPETLQDTAGQERGRHDWPELFEEYLGQHWGSKQQPSARSAHRHQVPQLTLGNLDAALAKVKGRRSAPGPDGVTNAMMEGMPRPIATKLLTTMQQRLRRSLGLRQRHLHREKEASHHSSPLAADDGCKLSEKTSSSLHSCPGPKPTWRPACPQKCSVRADRLQICCSPYIAQLQKQERQESVCMLRRIGHQQGLRQLGPRPD